MDENNQKKSEKNKHLPEEDITIYDESDSIAKSRQKSRKVFVFYIVALFSVALVIILASYVLQAHQQQQLNEQINVAEGAKSRADKIQDQLESLQEQIDELEGKLEDTNEQLEQAEADKNKAEADIRQRDDSIKALEFLWQLEKAYQAGDYDQAREIITEMDLSYGRKTLVNASKQPLVNDAAAEYQDICDALSE